MATGPPIPPPTPNPPPRPGAAPLAGRAGTTPGPAPNPYPGGGPPGALPGELAESAEHAALGMESAAGAAAGLAAALAHVPPPPAPPPLPPPVAPPPAQPPAAQPSLEAKFAWEERMAAGGWAAAHRQREEEAQAARRAFESLPPPAGPPPTYYPPPPPARDFAGAPAVVTHSAAEERAYAQAEAEFQRRLQAAQAGPPAPQPMAGPAAGAQASQPRAARALQDAFGRTADVANSLASTFLKLTPAVAVASAGFYGLQRLMNASNPVLGPTMKKSLELAEAHIGRGFGPAAEVVSSGLQHVGPAYTAADKYVPGALRSFVPGLDLADAFKGLKSLFGVKPDLSYEGLPPVRNLAPEEYALGFSGAGLQMGPLDTKVWQEQIKNALEALGGKMAEVADNTRGMGGGGFNYGR
jgi:hypothetical protein